MSGLSVLYEPKDAKVDVIFIHGLNGHRRKTWTKNDVFWPEELLPNDAPSARILTYGYDANVAHFWSRPAENRIDTLSNDFFFQLTNNRSKDDASDRPAIFVAHSLGGIIVANAMVDAATNTYSELSSCVRGIIFLGTPHRGSSKAKWGEQARKFISYFRTTNPELLKDLDQKSEKLAKLGDAFPTLLTTRGIEASTRIQVVCFYEGQPTGTLGKIVDEESATLTGHGKIMLDATHSEMCKFAKADDNMYRQVAEQITKWVKDFSKAVDSQVPKAGGNAYFNGINNGLQQYANNGNQTNQFGVQGR